MPHDLRRSCVLCAWRASCAKKFSMTDDALHCPDFTEDVELRREREASPAPDGEEKAKP